MKTKSNHRAETYTTCRAHRKIPEWLWCTGDLCWCFISSRATVAKWCNDSSSDVSASTERPLPSASCKQTIQNPQRGLKTEFLACNKYLVVGNDSTSEYRYKSQRNVEDIKTFSDLYWTLLSPASLLIVHLDGSSISKLGVIMIGLKVYDNCFF